MTARGDEAKVREKLLGEGQDWRWSAPEPELLGVIAPFLGAATIGRARTTALSVVWAYALERALGTEVLDAVHTVFRRPAPGADVPYNWASLRRAFFAQAQPPARPVWEAAAALARNFASPAITALTPPATGTFLAAARNETGDEQIALYAAAVATEGTGAVDEVATFAARLPPRQRAVLLAWCAGEGTSRAEQLADSAWDAAVQELAVLDAAAKVELLAAVGLSGNARLLARAMSETEGAAADVPARLRYVGLVAEWLDLAFPKTPQNRLLWKALLHGLPEELARLDRAARDRIVSDFLAELGRTWGVETVFDVRGGVVGSVGSDRVVPEGEPEPAPAPTAAPEPSVEAPKGSPRYRIVLPRSRPLADWVFDKLLSLRRTRVHYSIEEPEDYGRKTKSRFLNIALATRARDLLPRRKTLRPDSSYLVRLDIGPRDRASIVTNPVAVPTEALEPTSSQGYWFDVVLTSADVEVTPDAHRIFLPFEGPSWVCGCPGPEHVCAETERGQHLYVPLRTREGTGKATVRCAVYYENNVVQSARIELLVADGRESDGAFDAVIDYTLSSDFAGVDALAPRRLNVLTNETQAGTHTIVVKGHDRVVPVHIADLAAGRVLEDIRTRLTDITLGPKGEDSRYDADNRKRTTEFIEDLDNLARQGAFFLSSVVTDIDDRVYLRDQLQKRATIQITRVGKTVFPWSLVYDIPRETESTWTLCPLLENWEQESARLASYPEACPYADQHHMNVLCPYGFWGYRQIVEQPPSIAKGLPRTAIRVGKPATAAIARSLELKESLSDEHMRKLGMCLDTRFELSPCDSKETLRKALADPKLPLVYFYCHGTIGTFEGATSRVPLLEIGKGESIGSGDFATWYLEDGWPQDHWADVGPLVFINGCSTAALSPEDLASFAEALAGMKAAGVIGTEIPVVQEVAGEVALLFYTQLAGPDPQQVGVALHRMRIDLLRKGNVCGLAYTPFCLTDLVLEEAA